MCCTLYTVLQCSIIIMSAFIFLKARLLHLLAQIEMILKRDNISRSATQLMLELTT